MSKNNSLFFITGNPNKAKFLADYYHIPIEHQKLDLPEIQSLSLSEVVEDKARRAFLEVGKPVLVEDVSLVFHALGSLPGPFIKWFESSLGHEGLCRLLDGYDDRRATATVMYGYCDGENVHMFSGEMKGYISDSPRGEDVFGWDVVFVHDGEEKTRAELPKDEWSEKSMRTEALEKLAKFFKRIESRK
jgi:non-canonical purine NTP pyrophosphatase (RdgB/HAM1 family)